MHARKLLAVAAAGAILGFGHSAYATVDVIDPGLTNLLRNLNGGTASGEVQAINNYNYAVDVQLLNTSTYLTMSGNSPLTIPANDFAVAGTASVSLLNYRNVTDVITVQDTTNLVNHTANAGIIIGWANAYGEYTNTDRSKFGMPLSASLSLGGQYAGYHSKVLTEGPVEFADINDGGVTNVLTQAIGSSATIRMGKAVRDDFDDTSRFVSMQWRAPLTAASPLQPDGSSVNYAQPLTLASDVLRLSGMTTVTEPTAGSGRKNSDLYVLEMDYDPSIAIESTLELVWLDLGANDQPDNSDLWVSAVTGNFDPDGSRLYEGILSSWDDFKNDAGDVRDLGGDSGTITDANLADYLGSWGIDLASNKIWAVLDYTDAQFAVMGEPVPVPEPTSLAMLGLGAAMLLRRRRR